MTIEQPTFLLAEIDAKARAEALSKGDAEQRKSWRTCWDWDGPTVGGLAEIDSCVVETAEGGSVYAYMEQVRLLEVRPDGSWLAEIAMGVSEWWGKTPAFRWPKDGTKVILGIRDIWPPTRAIRAERERLAAEEDATISQQQPAALELVG